MNLATLGEENVQDVGRFDIPPARSAGLRRSDHAFGQEHLVKQMPATAKEAAL
jgi:hypothetical protein